MQVSIIDLLNDNNDSGKGDKDRCSTVKTSKDTANSVGDMYANQE